MNNLQGRKFALLSRTYQLPNGGTKEVPCYQLTKTECLYIATKFNDEARARLVLRWQDLELQEQERSPKGTYWLHFAVRPKDNRRKVFFIKT